MTCPPPVFPRTHTVEGTVLQVVFQPPHVYQAMCAHEHIMYTQNKINKMYLKIFLDLLFLFNMSE